MLPYSMNKTPEITMKKTKRSERIRLPMMNLALTEFLNLSLSSCFIILEEASQ